MKYIAALIACFFLASCGRFYEDITIHDDGTFTLKKEIQINRTILHSVLGFDSIFKDSSEHDTSDHLKKLDMTLESFLRYKDTASEVPYSALLVNRKKLEQLPGFISYEFKDTLIDSIFHVYSIAHVKDTGSLRQAHIIAWSSSDSFFRTADSIKKTRTESVDSYHQDITPPMICRANDSELTLTFHLPKRPDEPMPSMLNAYDPSSLQSMSNQLSETMPVYIRVFSDKLKTPKPYSELKQVPHGQKWKLNFQRLSGHPGEDDNLEETFTIRRK
jgi:hypothetical protein